MAREKNASSDNGQTVRAVRVSTVRKVVKLAVFILIVVGLFVGIGWGSYSSMGIDAIAYLCPLGALETLLASKTAIPRFIIALIVMLVLVALLGRAFCAWICPVPPVERFFRPKRKSAIGKRSEAGETDEPDKHAFVADVAEEVAGSSDEAGSSPSAPLTDEERALLATGCHTSGANAAEGGSAACGASPACASCLAPVGGERDGFKVDTRHGVLLGALASAAVFGFPVFCLICPVGLSIATVVAVWQAFVGHAPSWSLLVFPLILLVELVVFRKWCHALCPMGALMSLVGQKSLFKPRVKDDRCLRSQGIDCHACVNACPEELDPHSTSLPECTKCGACVDACPAHAIAMPAFSNKKKRND